MAAKIGFVVNQSENKPMESTYTIPQEPIAPRKSVVQVYFENNNRKLAYYNDQFDLHCGDLVYVEGKLEGLRGYVVEVNYNFKIKISEYKRVIAVADTTVNGQFFMAGSHFVTFDRKTLPADKAAAWYMSPIKEEDEFVSGSDDSFFMLDDLTGMEVGSDVGERGYDYYVNNRVKYFCLDGGKGYAIVEGTRPYEVEFGYRNGEISGITCSCFCSYSCKHEVAAMLQLREALKLIEENYAGEYERTGYFAAIQKNVLFAFAINGKKNGSLTL